MSRIERFEDIEVKEKGKGMSVNYKTNGKESSPSVDMVILSLSIEPRKDTSKLAKILGIPQDEHGFFAEKHSEIASVDTAKDGIFIVGCAQNPKDIQDSVAQSEATVGKILSLL